MLDRWTMTIRYVGMAPGHEWSPPINIRSSLYIDRHLPSGPVAVHCMHRHTVTCQRIAMVQAAFDSKAWLFHFWCVGGWFWYVFVHVHLWLTNHRVTSTVSKNNCCRLAHTYGHEYRYVHVNSEITCYMRIRIASMADSWWHEHVATGPWASSRHFQKTILTILVHVQCYTCMVCSATPVMQYSMSLLLSTWSWNVSRNVLTECAANPQDWRCTVRPLMYCLPSCRAINTWYNNIRWYSVEKWSHKQISLGSLDIYLCKRNPAELPLLQRLHCTVAKQPTLATAAVDWDTYRYTAVDLA